MFMAGTACSGIIDTGKIFRGKYAEGLFCVCRKDSGL